jgi:glycerate-2-kinase
MLTLACFIFLFFLVENFTEQMITFARAHAQGLDINLFSRRNDSYNFFAALDDLVKPWPTDTNVNDLLFMFTFLHD